MFSKRRKTKSFVSKTSAANRRKRLLSNNKKKVIWRHRAYVYISAFG